MSFYRLSIVTIPLSFRVSEILPLLCSSTTLFPTPLLVSPNFPMFPWKYRWMAFGLRRAKVASYTCSYIVFKISNLCGPDRPTSQMDSQYYRQTDDMQSQYHALHYSASRGNYNYAMHSSKRLQRHISGISSTCSIAED